MIFKWDIVVSTTPGNPALNFSGLSISPPGKKQASRSIISGTPLAITLRNFDGNKSELSKRRKELWKESQRLPLKWCGFLHFQGYCRPFPCWHIRLQLVDRSLGPQSDNESVVELLLCCWERKVDKLVFARTHEVLTARGHSSTHPRL